MKKVWFAPAMLAGLMLGSYALAQSSVGTVTLPSTPAAPAMNVGAQISQTTTALDGLVSGGVASVSAVAAAGSGYNVGDTITLADGSNTIHGVLNVTHIKAVGVTINAVGSGGTPGATTCTGTTGTGTKFQATSTIAGDGTLTAAVFVVSVAGDYTVRPTSLTAEPVTCTGSITGVTVGVSMGVLTATVNTAGVVTAAPSNPVAQGSTSGSGTSATFTLSYAPVAFIVGYPVHGWKVYNPNSSGDFWVSDNGATPAANGASSYRVTAAGGETKTAVGEAPPAGSVLKLIGNAIGDKFIARTW